MNNIVTLYKLDSAGRSRILKISTDSNYIVQESGLVDGNLIKNRSACTGKNIGKSNETTPFEQARLEAESKVTEKLKEGYFNTLEEAKSISVILPMLAKDYKKESHKVIFPCYVQPKLDGMRCLGEKTGLRSRQNTPIETMDHILTELGGVVTPIDGELYAHELSFQENMKLIKKKRPGSENVKYHVYDLIMDSAFSIRYNLLELLVAELTNVEIVPTFLINNEEELKEHHVRFLKEGYEGTIIRWGDEGYEANKRSSHLLKYKDFLDIAVEVINIVPSEKRPEQGVAVCKMLDGKVFQTGMKFSHVEREEILTNKSDYIGKTAEIRFFEYSDEGIPRFPVCVGFRIDK